MTNNPITKYQSAAFQTSNTFNQLIVAFDEVIKLLHQGRMAVEYAIPENAFAAFDKAFMIFTLLRQGINNDVEDKGILEVLTKLDAFFTSAMGKILELNTTSNNPEGVDELIKAVITVRDSIRDKAKEEGLV